MDFARALKAVFKGKHPLLTACVFSPTQSYIYGSHLQHWSKLRLSIPHRILGVRWNHKNAVRSTSSFVVEEEKFQEAFGSALSSD